MGILFRRIKSEGLAHNSYFVASGEEAILIDPRRDCDVYMDLAQQEGVRIARILETHRNEDYVAGSREVADRTGAEILHGRGEGFEFGYGRTVEDGEEFEFGSARVRAIHTPGHTGESMSYALYDLDRGGGEGGGGGGGGADQPVMVFTGDALFIGDVGRTDLYGKELAQRMAADLYRSIFERILPLGDGVILCPAHGAGSVCGGDISERDESTLGLERVRNPALRMGREEFIRFKSEEGLEGQPYFRRMADLNLKPPVLGSLPIPKPLSPGEFRRSAEAGAVILDTRQPAAFGAHIPKSYSVRLDRIPVFAGWVLPYDRLILLVLEREGDAVAAARCLIRQGYDNVGGYLRGGIEEWYNEGLPLAHLGLLSAQELKDGLDEGRDLLVLDVREKREWDEGHIAGARRIYVGHLKERLGEVPRGREIVVICSSGNRSTVAASLLLREGFRASSVLGGMNSWRAAGFQVGGGKVKAEGGRYAFNPL